MPLRFFKRIFRKNASETRERQLSKLYLKIIKNTKPGQKGPTWEQFKAQHGMTQAKTKPAIGTESADGGTNKGTMPTRSMPQSITESTPFARPIPKPSLEKRDAAPKPPQKPAQEAVKDMPIAEAANLANVEPEFFNAMKSQLSGRITKLTNPEIVELLINYNKDAEGLNFITYADRKIYVIRERLRQQGK